MQEQRKHRKLENIFFNIKSYKILYVKIAEQLQRGRDIKI